MFDPKYIITNRLLANIKQISEIIFELNSHVFPQIVLAKMEIKAREISAFSSTSIEGNPLPLTDVKKILKNKPEHARDSEKEVLNYSEALIVMNQLIVSRKMVFDLSLILGIQKTVTNDLIPNYQSGKIRSEPVFVNDPGKRQTVYWPPDFVEVLPLMSDLILFINDKKGEIDPLILAGICHRQFVIIHPFVDGNGRTARLVTSLLLANMGLNTNNLFSFENYYNQNIRKYFQTVGVLGNYYDIKDNLDFTLWLEYFTDGIIDELLRVKKELNFEAITPDRELQVHHKLLISHIQRYGYINDSAYCKLTNRAKATRNLDFRKLINLGIIEKYGKGKSTYYKLLNQS